MGTTANRAYPYSEATDPPQGNAQIQDLAEAVDADFAGLPILQAKKSIISAAQSTSSTSLAELGTADKVTGLVLPTDGLIIVSYRALWKVAGGVTAEAGLFLGSDQLKRVQPNGAPSGVGTSLGATGTFYSPLFSTSTVAQGLETGLSTSADSTLVGTGEVWGEDTAFEGHVWGEVQIEADAGTYDVGVRFKVSSGAGSVTVKDRKLRAYTIAFD